jgi:chromosome segregation ATPase
LLDREYARMPKPHELERRIEQLKLQNNEFSREISQRQEEINELKLTIMDKNQQLDLKRREYKELLENVENCYEEDFLSSILDKLNFNCYLTKG